MDLTMGKRDASILQGVPRRRADVVDAVLEGEVACEDDACAGNVTGRRCNCESGGECRHRAGNADGDREARTTPEPPGAAEALHCEVTAGDGRSFGES